MSSADLDVAFPEPQVDFPVVGLGASAGGPRALMEFFRHVDARSGAAYVVVVHLSPDHESSAPQLLQGVTVLPVAAVTERTRIEPNRVYVISPKSELDMKDGHLEPAAPGKRPSFTIDRFFITLAEAHRNRSVAVVLSGTGSDGTIGAKAVKAGGGVTIAQAPEDAEYDAMPRNAIASGAVDFALPAAAIPGRLAAIWQSAKHIELPTLEDRPSPEDVAAVAEDALRDILAIVRARTGQDFSQYKRATLMRRIERRMQVTQVNSLTGYRDFVRQHADEARQLLRDLLISVTSFFRDAVAFEALEKRVIPALFAGKERGGKIRIWVVGCATGEEAYSIAMLLVEHAQQVHSPAEINIFATDIDEEALAYARAAVYPETIKEQMSAERLRRFFVKEQDGYRLQKSLRELVMFATHNAIQDPPFSKVDLVSCRNLLIYLNRHVQTKVLDLVHFSLRAEGFLFLGMSEAVDDTHDGFVVLDKVARIYQQQPRARMGMLVASLPTVVPTRIPGDVQPVARRLVSYSELHQNLLEHYAPPSLVVDERYEVVHLSENAGRFLHIGGGEPSLNVIKVAPEELRFELRSALEQAMQTMHSVERPDLPLRRGPQLTHVTLKIHPVREKTTTRSFALVIFDEAADSSSAPSNVRLLLPHDQLTERLEERLHDTQAQLRAAVEQYEIQNEELKASNEELQATNEELRATSEELETGKEELQSINEELTTVNQELKNKIDETTRISDDLQNFINATEIPVLFVDRELRLMRFTPFARRIFNLIGSDIGRPLLDVTHKLKQVTLEADIASVFETLHVIEREMQAADGAWYILRILPYRTKEDRIGGAVLTFVDISQRKAAEDTMQRNRSWLQVVVDSAMDYAILTMGPDGNIETWNRGAEKIFGYTAQEAIGNHLSMLFLPEDRSAGAPENELRVARETGRCDDNRWQLRKDGTRFYASGVTAPLQDVKLHGYVKLCQDLTEQQLADQRRAEDLSSERTNREAAEQANRIKDEFLATLSHELRNPLALVLMQSELLLRAPELRSHARLANAVEVIHQMVRTQSQFVEDLLDVSRARTGKLAVERQLVPLPFLIADSINELRYEAERNDITLDIEITQDPLIVEADAVRVKQVAWNLLSNAFKFTPRGGRVKVTLGREGDDARLDVEDSGQGIDADLLPHVFDWFRQGEGGATRRKGGMGIGLALVRQLVELHGGRVDAHSDGPGKGSRFTVWLPLQQAVEPRAYAPPTAPLSVEERLRGIRVLVIDDAPGNAEALRELLQLEGSAVSIATTAHDAVTLAQNQAFDVIVSDLAMPMVDGHTLLRQIHATPLNGSTPAIAYSGYGGPEDVARSKAAGFDEHVTKPADLDKLVEIIGALKAKRRA